MEFEAGDGRASGRTGRRRAGHRGRARSADGTHAERRTCVAGALQDRFTFETFVLGPANEFAHAVARRVASWADGHFNPVVFHRSVRLWQDPFAERHGLGSHATTAPNRKIVYLTAERFLSRLRARPDGAAALPPSKKNCGRLICCSSTMSISSAASSRSQEELFHTLAALMEDGRRVVFSADRPPSALSEIDAPAALAPLVRAGLRHRAGRPDAAAGHPGAQAARRFAASRASRRACKPESSQFLADRFTDSVRELEGALNTLIVRAGAGLRRR